MTHQRNPAATQAEFANWPIEPVLLIAPAGCGKTEALVQRAGTVIGRGDVVPPRKLLALTYSNKAKADLAVRTRRLVGRNWRRSMTITNFHGLATRLIQSHGAVIGVDPAVTLPDKVWRKKAVRAVGAEWDDDFEIALRHAKADDADDELVMERLQEVGHSGALAFQEMLRTEGRIDFDDQLRHAARLLADPSVARLYQAHFALVMVDEVQDLSMRQLGMVMTIGGAHVTYAGDRAQGIYSFAGAQPVEVFETIHASGVTVLELCESYRSSLAVLKTVNALAEITGSSILTCGAPQNFPDDGQVLLLSRSTTVIEAEALSEFFTHHDLTATSIGVVSRRWPRLNDLRQVLPQYAIGFLDWAAPTHVARVVELIKRFADEAAVAPEDVRVEVLEKLCREAIASDDSDTHNEIVMACEALQGMVETGTEFMDAVASCRTAPDPDAAVSPGVHLLSGHVGKGQEFDWVVVLGLEDGHIPDYRSTTGPAREEELRVLHVMLSRARYGLVLTSADHTPTRFGWRQAEPSPWLGQLAATATGNL